MNVKRNINSMRSIGRQEEHQHQERRWTSRGSTEITSTSREALDVKREHRHHIDIKRGAGRQEGSIRQQDAQHRISRGSLGAARCRSSDPTDSNPGRSETALHRLIQQDRAADEITQPGSTTLTSKSARNGRPTWDEYHRISKDQIAESGLSSQPPCADR